MPIAGQIVTDHGTNHGLIGRFRVALVLLWLVLDRPAVRKTVHVDEQWDVGHETLDTGKALGVRIGGSTSGIWGGCVSGGGHACKFNAICELNANYEYDE